MQHDVQHELDECIALLRVAMVRGRRLVSLPWGEGGVRTGTVPYRGTTLHTTYSYTVRKGELQTRAYELPVKFDLFYLQKRDAIAGADLHNGASSLTPAVNQRSWSYSVRKY
jgi:hypothetical protein